MIGQAQRYVRSVRNEAKREYAAEFLRWLMGERTEPTEYGCSYMAAQAVRSRLHTILDPKQTGG